MAEQADQYDQAAERFSTSQDKNSVERIRARFVEIGLAGIVPGSEARVKHTIGCRMISRGIISFELSHLLL